MAGGGKFNRGHTWSGNETIKTTDLNAEFNNVIQNLTPAKLDNFSANVSQMQQTQSPGAVGTEVLAADLSQELMELRYQIGSITGGAQWYSAPANSISSINATLNSLAFIPANRIMSGAVSANQPMFLLPGGSTDTVTFKATATNFSSYINNTLSNFIADITLSSLTVAPNTNNTCVVVDATLAGTQSTKIQGERRTYITIGTVGSNITALNGQFAAFKVGAEYFIAEVDTTNSRLKNAFRGFFFNSSGTALPRVGISNGDTITLMKLTWVFLTNATNVPGIDVTYNKPTVSYSAPASPSIGDYWLDLSVNQWKKYSGSVWSTQTAIMIGVCVQDATNCVAARSFDFYKPVSDLNTLYMEIVDTANIRSSRLGARISVYGSVYSYDYDYVKWNTTNNLDSGVSLIASTTYFAYVSDLGSIYLSDIAPYDRTADLQGWYHPSKPWRCVGEIATDASSNLVNNAGFNVGLYQQKKIQVDSFGGLVLGVSSNGWTSNLGISYSANTLSICGVDGAGLSRANPGYVALQAKTAGQVRAFPVTANVGFVDASGTSQITGNLFGVTTGVAWAQDVPFYVYAVMKSDGLSVTFALSRTPCARTSPTSNNAKAGGTGATTDLSFLYMDSSITVANYVTQPCVCIGSVRLQKTTVADDWTVQALSNLDGIGQFHDGTFFTMPTGQNGAASGKYFATNGGTAPTFSSDNYFYSVTRGGIATIIAQLSNCTVAGVSANQLRFALPLASRTVLVTPAQPSFTSATLALYGNLTSGNLLDVYKLTAGGAIAPVPESDVILAATAFVAFNFVYPVGVE